MGCSLLPFPVVAIAAEAEPPADVSFLEYLGMMVETEEKDVWLDPLDLDNDALVKDRPVQANDANADGDDQPLAQGESS